MKIKVISEFYDKFHTSTLFKVGTVLDFEKGRAKDVIARKLAEPYKEEKPKVEMSKVEPKTEAKVEVKAGTKQEPKEKAEPVKADKK